MQPKDKALLRNLLCAYGIGSVMNELSNAVQIQIENCACPDAVLVEAAPMLHQCAELLDSGRAAPYHSATWRIK